MAQNGVTSQGLMGLPHYRTSRVATSMYEPIYKNLFTVQITCPDGMASTWNQDLDVILEGCTKVTGLNTNKSSGGVKDQHYKFANRSFAGAHPDNTYVDITIDWELNIRYEKEVNTPENYTWKFLRDWNALIYDPLTGRMGLKRDYVAKNMIVTMQDRKGTPYWQWILYNIFPTDPLPDPGLDYQSSDLLKATQKYRCDYWDEVIL